MFIDDERFPATEGWVIVRSSSFAIDTVKQLGMPSVISFDHDLGGNDTSRVFILWLLDELADSRISFPENFEFKVHSQNPIGAAWIQGTMENLVREFS